MESCTSYRPWHDKFTGKTFLKPGSGKCLHYYFYFIDEELGLCHVRVPELGNNFGIRIEGTRIKHRMGSASIKMYDKCGLVLRIETTANDVSFFKHHRKVEQRDGTTVYKRAPLPKIHR
jgi:hypothetical protein